MPPEHQNDHIVAQMLLNEGIDVRIPVTGQSMLPFLRTGDIVTIRPCKASDLTMFDIATHTLHSKIVLHRVIFLSKDAITTTGDAYHNESATIDPERVIGKVSLIERGNRVWCPHTAARKIAASLWFQSRRLRRYLRRSRNMIVQGANHVS